MNVLEIRNVTKRFGNLVAVRDISLNVAKGEFCAIIGPNGAGKTTLLNCISGVLRPSSGSIELDSQQLIGRRPHQIAALGVARTFQAVEHYKELTVTEYILLGILRDEGEAGTTLAGLGLTIPELETAVQRELDELVKRQKADEPI